MSTLPEKVKSWMGEAVVRVDGVLVAEQGLWQNFCAAVQDGNPLYWDARVAACLTDTVIAPPAMLPSWCIEHDWCPEDQRLGLRTLELHFMLKDALGLPFGVVSEVELEFHRPVRSGDVIAAEQSIRYIQDEKKGRNGGVNRRWGIDVPYKNQDGALVGVQTLHFFSYRKA
ncbi:MAG: MaoC family dehydratase N-terminal domain-containing protein [Ectothiorhodospiraceae bacterium]|nr:MaoC family dehydratase N-terminal domain-containing protein [Ectothiorhodospiraceae bacterium]